MRKPRSTCTWLSTVPASDTTSPDARSSTVDHAHRARLGGRGLVRLDAACKETCKAEDQRKADVGRADLRRESIHRECLRVDPSVSFEAFAARAQGPGPLAGRPGEVRPGRAAGRRVYQTTRISVQSTSSAPCRATSARRSSRCPHPSGTSARSPPSPPDRRSAA